MRKNIFYDKGALRELYALNREAQKDFQACIEVLGFEGKLEFPDARKVTRSLYEIRVSQGNIYRGFYAYVGKDYIVILHFFQKKTQKTPQRNIKTAQQRLQKYV